MPNIPGEIMSELVKNIVLEDGRRAERRSYENCESESVQESVQELWAEKPVQKFLNQRIVEKRAPVLVERETQILDEEGKNVVKTITEKPDYQLKEKTVTIIKEAPELINVDDDPLKSLKEDVGFIKEQLSARKGNKKVSMQEVVEVNVTEKKWNKWDLAGLGIIAAQVCAVIYFLFFF